MSVCAQGVEYLVCKCMLFSIHILPFIIAKIIVIVNSQEQNKKTQLKH